MKKTIIGIMGSGDASATADMAQAEAFARHVAKRGWVVLTGGRPAGVMKAAHEGAKKGGGLIVGILPYQRADGDHQHCPLVDIPIYTGLGDARNAITGQAPDVVVAFVEEAGPGTISEVALACKAKRPVVLVGPRHSTTNLAAVVSDTAHHAEDADAAMRQVEATLEKADRVG